MNSSIGRTFKLFLVDGIPNGLMTAEIMNWTGHVITAPRARLAALLQRDECAGTGVYFLVGPEQGPGIGADIYIGETDSIRDRLRHHNRTEEHGGKDFWERVCIVTSKDANLTKSHAKFLESRLISIAQQSGRCILRNGTDPRYEALPEADRSDMEFFLAQIRTLLPVLGLDFLREAPTTVSGQAPEALPFDGPDQNIQSPIFKGDVPKHGITARAQEINGEFVVLEGSKARMAWEGVHSPYTSLFEELVRSGVLVPASNGLLRQFSRNYAFSSPSAAAAVVAGRPANGRIHWIDEATGTTYGAWQEAQVARALGHPVPIAPTSLESRFRA